MGEGVIYSEQCKTCKGEKVIIKETEITLQNISKLRNNTRNIHPGYGHQSKYYREKVGSLVLNINIIIDNDFQFSGNDIYKTLNIHFQDAIDGKSVEYTHVDDTKIKIKLPEKSQNNNIISLKNKGLLKNEKDRGDLLVKINIIIDYDRLKK
jgi:molecular chaperone DnaJ